MGSPVKPGMTVGSEPGMTVGSEPVMTGKSGKKPVKIWSVCHDDYLCCVEIVREI